MRTSDLLLTGLDISEDGYNFKAHFILKTNEKSKSVDLTDLDSNDKLQDLKDYFDLSDSIAEIRNQLMEKVMEKASISSKIVEGENFEKTVKYSRIERLINNLDLA